jgi:hypothetical protein
MQILAYIGAWIGIAGFVWVCFERADSVAKDEARDSAGKFLSNLEVGQLVNDWSKQFCHVFDAVFGERHFKWKCIWRSFLSSLLAVTIISALQYDQLFKYVGLTGAKIRVVSIEFNISTLVVFAFISIGGALLINWLPDYVSLLETRWILGRLETNSNALRIAIFLSIDLLVTPVIFLCYYFLLEFLYSPFTVHYVLSAKVIISPFDLFSGEWSPWVIFFFSTFFTSVWVWFYALASMTVVLLSKLQTPWLWLRDNFLDIDQKPILAMGWIASMIVTVIFLVSIPFVF